MGATLEAGTFRHSDIGLSVKKLSLLSACIFALFLASCGGSSGGSGGSADADSDGVPDLDADGSELDKCRKSLDKNFISTPATDYDGDGCKDDDPNGEDKDDDNDGVPDVDLNGDTTKDDKCPKGNFFTSTSTTDYDSDGCRDRDEDSDDNGDGVEDRDADVDGFGDAVDVDDNNNGLIDIYNYADLNNIRYDLDGSHYDDEDDDYITGDEGSNAGCFGTVCIGYELANNIILVAPTDADASNWVPIEGKFTTTLKGNGNTISNITIVNTTQYTGFFEVLDTYSAVQDLSFVGGSVTSINGDDANYVGVLAGRSLGKISNVSVELPVFAGTGNYNRVGGLVGFNGGFIKNSYATGNVDGNAGSGNYVGGLVGYNLILVQNSYATGKVSSGAGAGSTGGLVGYNKYGSIRNSYATGNANSGAGTDSVGGLVGINEGFIQNSYATGRVDGGEGNDWAGGLVGYIISGKLQYSYFLGTVDGGSGKDNVGRLVGYKAAGTITSNYYNSESTLPFVPGEDTKLTLNDPEALGKTSDQLKAINLDPPDNQAACEAAGGTWDGASSCTSGNLASWNALDWDLIDGFYPSLKSYKQGASGGQVTGNLLCGQLPEADFVQCPMP